MWTEKQKRRLSAEKKILERKLPQFKFFNLLGTYVAGKTKTSDGRMYLLRLDIGKGFPEEMPRLYVVTPFVLPKYGGGTINEEGISHFFHTRDKAPCGEVQICHDALPLWNASKSIFGVMLKGLIWLEGYCQHLKTGKSIAEFCDETKKPIILTEPLKLPQLPLILNY